jgi:hypothetical protein
MRKYRIVQWAMGNVGRRAVIAINANPHLELVGCYVHGAAKAGQDAGALAGIGPIGVTTTQDVEALLALKPDCVNYNGLWANPDDFCRILERGINIVTTSAFVRPLATASSMPARGAMPRSSAAASIPVSAA